TVSAERSLGIIDMATLLWWAASKLLRDEAAGTPSSVTYPLVQVPKNDGCNAPDFAFAELHNIGVQREAVPIKGRALVIFGRHQNGERQFESRLDLAAVQPE